MNGTVRIAAGDTELGSKTLAQDDGQKNVKFILDSDALESTDAIDVDIDFVPISYRRSRSVFKVGNGSVETSTTKQDGFDVVMAKNDVIEMKAAPDYAPGLFSCKYLGREWLDTDYPELKPRDWWNPWVGGFLLCPAKMEGRPLLREKASARPVEVTDNYGNMWKGICITVVFSDHEELRGLEYDQYFLLLPGVPVVGVQVRIRQNTGTRFEGWRMRGELHIGSPEQTAKTSLYFRNSHGQRARLISGYEESYIHPKGLFTGEIEGNPHSVILYVDRDRTSIEGYTQKRSTSIDTHDRITCSDGDTKTIPARFAVFSKEIIDEELLADLRYVDLLNEDK